MAAVAGGSVWLCPQDLQDRNDELQAALGRPAGKGSPELARPPVPGPAAQQVGAECLEMVGLLGCGRDSCPGGGGRQPAVQGSQVLRTTCVGEGSYPEAGLGSRGPKGDEGGGRSYCLDRVSGEL